MITEFTPFTSFIGGLMIGISAVMLMAINGRIAGISGLIGGLFTFDFGAALWRILFLIGIILAPYFYQKTTGILPEFAVTSHLKWLIVGGLLVGFGVTIGRGCTSGHGICGMARMSKRSVISTAIFMVSAMVMVYLMRHTAYF